MEHGPIPKTYLESYDRARAIAIAEKPFKDAVFIYCAIEDHFECILNQRAEEFQEYYDERRQLALPVEYYYLEQLCIRDLRNFVESETIERVLCNIFFNFMEDYGYRAEEMVPSIPLGYLLSLIGDFNQRIDEHMKNVSIDAERKYIASMN